MTSSYHQNRTRLFLPIKGNHDISKTAVLRWVAYTVKLAYMKLSQRDISFLKVKARGVRALSSSWTFFDKVLLNDILKAAVWKQSMFLSKNKKNNVYPCKTQFYYIKVGFKEVKII